MQQESECSVLRTTISRSDPSPSKFQPSIHFHLPCFPWFCASQAATNSFFLTSRTSYNPILSHTHLPSISQLQRCQLVKYMHHAMHSCTFPSLPPSSLLTYAVMYLLLLTPHLNHNYHPNLSYLPFKPYSVLPSYRISLPPSHKATSLAVIWLASPSVHACIYAYVLSVLYMYMYILHGRESGLIWLTEDLSSAWLQLNKQSR